MDVLTGVLLGLFVAVLGGCVGHIAAHEEIAHECKVLEKFYIGDTVYECKQLTTK